MFTPAQIITNIVFKYQTMYLNDVFKPTATLGCDGFCRNCFSRGRFVRKTPLHASW